jgi:hypothetical protein
MGQSEKPDGVKLDNKIPIKNNLNHFGGGGGVIFWFPLYSLDILLFFQVKSIPPFLQPTTFTND